MAISARSSPCSRSCSRSGDPGTRPGDPGFRPGHSSIQEERWDEGELPLARLLIGGCFRLSFRHNGHNPFTADLIRFLAPDRYETEPKKLGRRRRMGEGLNETEGGAGNQQKKRQRGAKRNRKSIRALNPHSIRNVCLPIRREIAWNCQTWKNPKNPTKTGLKEEEEEEEEILEVKPCPWKLVAGWCGFTLPQFHRLPIQQTNHSDPQFKQQTTINQTLIKRCNHNYSFYNTNLFLFLFVCLFVCLFAGFFLSFFPGIRGSA